MLECGQEVRGCFEAVYDHVLKGVFRRSIVASYSEASVDTIYVQELRGTIRGSVIGKHSQGFLGTSIA